MHELAAGYYEFGDSSGKDTQGYTGQYTGFRNYAVDKKEGT